MKWTNKGHQFDSLGKNFTKRNRIYIYGAGKAGEWTYDQLKFLNCVDGFIDQDKMKQSNGVNGLPVYSPDILFKGYDEKHLIIIAIKDEMDAAQRALRLELAGYFKNYDFFYYKEFVPSEHTTSNVSDNLYIKIYSVYAQDKIWLNSIAIYPSTVCNMRCKNCLAFTPYIKQHRIKTLEESKQEVDVFFKWVDYVRWFQISGGEPQLWPEFCELVEYIGKKYRNRIGDRFEFVTNGTIVPPERLIALMKQYNMMAVVDDYSINDKITLPIYSQEILRKLENNGINYIYVKPEKWFDLGVFECDNRKLDLVEYFNNCAIPFRTNEYGKIYLCAYADFAIKAGIMEENENEFFDLNEEMTSDKKKEFTEFVLGYSTLGYSQLCRRCYGWGDTVNHTVIPVAEQEEKR